MLLTTTPACSLLRNSEKIILSFSLRSANMVSFPETNDDLTSRLITGARAKNDAFKFTVALQRSSN